MGMKPEAAGPMRFRSRDPGYFYELHNESRRQYVITLSGQLEREIGGGRKLRFGPGDVIFAVGLAVQGHSTRTIGMGARRGARHRSRVPFRVESESST